MKKLCTILARGGSKGVANKNIRLLAGKPLLVHTILQARQSNYFDGVLVSSDSDLILNTAKDWGIECLIRRPEAMAHDTAPKLPAIQHAVLEAEKYYKTTFDIICDLDPTSPFRRDEDIRECLLLAERADIDNVITGAPARKSPYFNLVETDADGFAKLSKSGLRIGRRQDSPSCFDMNASIYAWRRRSLFRSESIFQNRTLLYSMPRERSIEIDTEFDFEIAEYFASKGGL